MTSLGVGRVGAALLVMAEANGHHALVFVCSKGDSAECGIQSRLVMDVQGLQRGKGEGEQRVLEASIHKQTHPSASGLGMSTSSLRHIKAWRMHKPACNNHPKPTCRHAATILA